MIRCLFVGVVWLAGMLCAVPTVAADIRFLVVREDGSAAKQFTEVLHRELGRLGWGGEDVILPPDRAVIPPHREGEQIIVALGARALQAAGRHAQGRFLVGALVSRSALEEIGWNGGERSTAIVLNQPPERWINLIATAFPKAPRIGIVVGPEGQKHMRALERKFSERRIALVVEPISAPEEAVLGTQRLVPRVDVLLALPDTVAHNRFTVQALLMTTYRAGVPVVSYSESYLQAGSTLALYSTIPEIASQVVESLQQMLDGRAVSGIQSPRYFSVGVNSAVARSLGVSLPAVREIEERLRSADQ